MELDQAAIFTWLANNWYLVVVVVISEAMPFLNTEANGVAHAILNALDRIKGGKV